ncbi:class I SAM-dependent methyltransferase [Deltaproteobacteria bacterium OttesenSCG-928-K17]|nr:class I SAM-dependent methyltransferase [Deltaproteobacteria bacterium OttesenSCG-928-K17]
MIPDPASNIWVQTKESLYALYEKRAAGDSQEMDCHAQAAELYAPHFKAGDKILDAGGGSGCFFWSLKKRGLLGHYYLLDYTSDFVDMGKRHLAAEKGAAGFYHQSIQQAPGRYEAVFCLNALFCLPDWRQGLERLFTATEKIIVVRSTFAQREEIRFETDAYLDPEAKNLKSYFNIWPLETITAFMESFGFKVFSPIDARTNDKPEISAGKIFPWRWLVGLR